MTIAFGCEQCGKQFQVAEELAGKRVKCKQCGEVLIVPATSRSADDRAARLPEARPKTEASRRAASAANASSFDPFDLGQAPGSPTQAGRMPPPMEDVLPRRPGPLPNGAKKKKRRAFADAFEAVRGPILLVALAFFAATFVWGLFNFLGIVAFGLGILVAGFGLMAGGVITGLLLAFQAGLGEGVKRVLIWGAAGFGVWVAGTILLTGQRAAREAYVRSELKDTQALAAEALAEQPDGLSRDAVYDLHVKLTRALIAETNEEADVLMTIHDVASAQALVPRLRDLTQLGRRLHARRQQLPPLSSSELFWLGARYNDVFGAANRRFAHAVRRAQSYPGTAPILASVVSDQPRGLPAPSAGNPSFPGFPAGVPAPSGPSFTVVVQEVPDSEAANAVMKRLGEIHGKLVPTGSRGVEGRGSGTTHTYTLRPIVDLSAFAAEVDFGQVVNVGSGRLQVRFTHLPPGAEPQAAPIRTAEAPVGGLAVLPSTGETDEKYPPARLTDEPLIRGNPRELFRDVAPNGAVLVGVRVSYVNAFGGQKIGSVQPVYRAGEALIAGDRHGASEGPQIEAVAKPGYAVGGIRAHSGILVDGFELVFMRHDGKRLDPADSYQSDWLGDPKGGGPHDVDSHGRPAVGIVGRCQREVNELGLVILTR